MIFSNEIAIFLLRNTQRSYDLKKILCWFGIFILYKSFNNILCSYHNILRLFFISHFSCRQEWWKQNNIRLWLIVNSFFSFNCFFFFFNISFCLTFAEFSDECGYLFWVFFFCFHFCITLITLFDLWYKLKFWHFILYKKCMFITWSIFMAYLVLF